MYLKYYITVAHMKNTAQLSRQTSFTGQHSTKSCEMKFQSVRRQTTEAVRGFPERHARCSGNERGVGGKTKERNGIYEINLQRTSITTYVHRPRNFLSNFLWPSVLLTITLPVASVGFVFGTARSRYIHRYSSRTFAGHRSPWRVAVHRVTAWSE